MTDNKQKQRHSITKRTATAQQQRFVEEKTAKSVVQKEVQKRRRRTTVLRDISYLPLGCSFTILDMYSH